MITETLLRDDRLRDAVALSREYDAGRVRLEESDASSYVWYEDGHYEYEGETYAVSDARSRGVMGTVVSRYR
ncbi:hypothetical protein D8S78_15785 [Natrialba swarupiae]|nr:hypothetical protein [Natrialba swarupiae]